MKNNKILYWPGRGQGLKVLKYFRNELLQNGFSIDVIDVEYDRGELNPLNWTKVKENDCNWWIGISLGASLLYYALNYVDDLYKPTRITLINPFSSRKNLSNEMGFDLTNQWDFSPIENIVNVDQIELVSSVFDVKIPMYHGINLLNKTISSNKKLIFIDEKHTIDLKEAQIELAQLLCDINIIEKGKKGNGKGYNYCNVYK